MSKTITIRFYKVTKNTQSDPSFEEVLKSLQERVSDEKSFYDEGCNYFLYHFTKKDKLFEGEFVRTDEDYDATTCKENELKPLIEDNLAVTAVFLYDTESEVLILQGSFLSSRISVLERFKKYMNNFYQGQYNFKPLSKGDLNERIHHSEFMQLELSIDTTSILGTPLHEYHDLNKVERNLGASTVKMSYTIGRQGALIPDVRNLINRVIASAGIGIEKARIQFVEDKQMVDIFKDYILFETKSIDLPKDPIHSREIRISLLKEVRNEHSGKLVSIDP